MFFTHFDAFLFFILAEFAELLPQKRKNCLKLIDHGIYS